jgi:hypothetical protein
MAATVANLTLMANWMSSGGSLRAFLRRFWAALAALAGEWLTAAYPGQTSRRYRMLITA